MYDFFLYFSSVNGQKFIGSYVVLRLLEALSKYKNFKIFFDNWFRSILWCLALKDYGYLATATLRADRTKGCPLPAGKDLKMRGRGSRCFKTNVKSGISVTKLFDNKCAQSNYYNPDSVAKVRRCDRQKNSSLKLTDQ